METLIVFLIVFLPVGWMVWRMLRSTRDTIGTNSPLKVQRIYHTTAWSFFGRLDYLFVLMTLFFSVLMLNAVFTAKFAAPHPELGRAVLVAISLICLCLGALVPIVDFNHWPYSYGVVITTFPDTHEVEIAHPGGLLRVREGDLRQIIVYNTNSKLQLGFTEFHFTNGDSLTLSDRTEGLWVIQGFFKNVPVEYRVRHFPLIGKPGRYETAKAGGFHNDKPEQGWITFSIMFLVGISLLAVTYMMYADAKWQDDKSATSPVVCMNIRYRVRGAGTVKLPDEVYAEYQGKTYHFEMGRKYFRSLFGVDTIAVYYDAATDRAFLPSSGKVRHYRGLYVLVAGGGLVIIAGSIWEFTRLMRFRRRLRNVNA